MTALAEKSWPYLIEALFIQFRLLIIISRPRNMPSRVHQNSRIPALNHFEIVDNFHLERWIEFLKRNLLFSILLFLINQTNLSEICKYIFHTSIDRIQNIAEILLSLTKPWQECDFEHTRYANDHEREGVVLVWQAVSIDCD